MLNNSKIYKVLPIVGALFFASFYSVNVRAEDDYNSAAQAAAAAQKELVEANQRLKAAQEAEKNHLAEMNMGVVRAKEKCLQNGSSCEEYYTAEDNYKKCKEGKPPCEGLRKAIEDAREAKKAAEKKLRDANKDAQREVSSARKDAEKAQKKANEQAKKYCNQNSKNYDKTKCEQAQKDINNANSQLENVNKAAYTATGQDALVEYAKEQRDQEYKNNQAQIEEYERQLAELEGVSGETANRKRQELEAEKKALEDRNKGIEQAKKKEDAGSALDNARQARDDAKKNVEAVEQEIAAKKQELDKILNDKAIMEEKCKNASAKQSEQSQAEAQEFCAAADKLRSQAAQSERELQQLERALDDAKTEANIANEEVVKAKDAESSKSGIDRRGQEYYAYATRSTGNFGASEDVFKTVTRRALRILVGLKPIVYVFAGFGLIAFAWMAIFNKISWKWFANLAMSLFLVANIGRFIEYFVFPTSGDSVNAKPLTSFGDYLHNSYADTRYEWVTQEQIASGYVPEGVPQVSPEVISDEVPDVGINVPEAHTETRGFCEAENSGGGLFGGGGFSSCVKDVIAAGKKAVDTYKKVDNTIKTVQSGVEQIKYAAENIEAAAQQIGKGNLEDTFSALAQIGQNINNMTGAAGGIVGNVMYNASAISNNLQDITKSRDEVAELNQKRSRGEATNQFDALLKGQVLDEDGNAERTDDGRIAQDSNFFTTVQDVSKDVTNKTRAINQVYQDGMTTFGQAAGVVGNFDAWGLMDQSINEKRQEKEKLTAAGQQAASQTTAITAYDDAMNKSAKAENKAAQAEKEAQNAQKNAEARADEAAQLEAAAAAARQKAEMSGSEQDKLAAELAETRAKAARTQADNAQKKADSAQKSAEQARAQANSQKAQADALRGSARDQEMKNAQNLEKFSEKVIQQAEKDIEENQKKLAVQQAALDSAEKKLLDAIQKAQKSGSDKDYQEVARLQKIKENAEKAISETEKNIKENEHKRDNASQNLYESQMKQMELEAEKNGVSLDDVFADDEETSAKTDKQAASNKKSTASAAQTATKKSIVSSGQLNVPRKGGASSVDANNSKSKSLSVPNTPQQVYVSKMQTAQQAESAAQNKEKSATKARENAQSKQDTADKLSKTAEKALAQAQKTGLSADKKAANLAVQRAEIAKTAADTAKKAALEAKKAADEARKQANVRRNDAEVAKKSANTEQKSIKTQAVPATEIALTRPSTGDSDAGKALVMATKTKAANAEKEAAQAQKDAEKKAAAAQKAALDAKKAQDAALANKSAEAQRAAILAQKRADLAAAEASKAQSSAQAKKKTAKTLSSRSKSMARKQAEKDVEKYKQAMTAAETAMSSARGAIAAAELELEELNNQYNRMMIIAKAQKTEEAYAKAEAIANQINQKEKQLNEARQNLETQIRLQSDAQRSYYAALESQNTMEKQEK